MGLCSVILLLVMALAITAHRGERKSAAVVVANSCADRVLERFLDQLPGADSPLWQQSSFAQPYQLDQSQVGSQLFESRLYLETVGAGVPGLLRCTVNVSWSAGSQQGLQALSLSRLIYAP